MQVMIKRGYVSVKEFNYLILGTWYLVQKWFPRYHNFQFIVPFSGRFWHLSTVWDGCQRVLEPVLSPLLYKSVS